MNEILVERTTFLIIYIALSLIFPIGKFLRRSFLLNKVA